MQAANAKSYKTASIGKKIVFPILFMAFFQIIIFWLFTFQLGLFDSVVQQAKKTFLITLPIMPIPSIRKCGFTFPI